MILLSVTVSVSPPVAGDDAETESWTIIRFDGKPVGYEQTGIRISEEDSRPVVTAFRKTRLKLKRMGTDLTLDATLAAKQTPSGVLRSFDLFRVDGSGARTERSGRYIPERRVFEIEEKVHATRRSFDLRVPGDVYSPVLSTWLPSVVLQSNGRVSLPVLFPESAAVSDISADRRLPREIRLNGLKKITATEILFSPRGDPGKLTRLYVDGDGQVLKHERKILGGTLTLEKSSPENALAAVTTGSLDLDVRALIPIDRMIRPSAVGGSLVLEVAVKNGYLRDIPETAFQKTRRISPSAVQVTLSPVQIPRSGAASSSRLTQPLPPSTHWMPLNDPVLQRLAAAASGGRTDPGEICRRMEDYVRSKMKHSSFSASTITADETARQLRGDCTEHAVLLAAMMRIHRIPSRVAAGVIHTSRQYGFSGHAWTEAYIDGQWIPFDSAVDSRKTGAVRIKLADSEMPEDMTGTMSLFLPVLDLTGRASVRIVSDR